MSKLQLCKECRPFKPKWLLSHIECDILDDDHVTAKRKHFNSQPRTALIRFNSLMASF